MHNSEDNTDPADAGDLADSGDNTDLADAGDNYASRTRRIDSQHARLGDYVEDSTTSSTI